MPTETIILLVLLISAGFYMAWSIGANDVANAIGTSVGSGALTLRMAVIIAAILEFSGAFFFGSHVSDTIQTGIIDPNLFASDPKLLVYGMLSSLLAAGIWLQAASYFGWPVSTTHCIVGAIVGFGLLLHGFHAIQWDNVFFIVSSWVVSPLIGGIMAYQLFNIFRKNIFHSKNPIAATKKIIPFIVFTIITTMGILLIYNGLQNIGLQYTFFDAVIFSMLVGLIAAIISIFLLRNITTPQKIIDETFNSNESIIALEKAKKQLKKVKDTSDNTGIQTQIDVLIDELENVDFSLKVPPQGQVHSSEYATVEKIFGYLQIISACLMAFAHGANDVANAIGPLTEGIEVLLANSVITATTTPTWALALGGFGIVIGLATWGWRVIETIGKKITELTPTRGFAAELATALTVVFASRLGLPISTTHTLVGSVIGVGLARGIEALDLSMTRDIVISWLVTVPAGAFLAIVLFNIINFIF